MLSFCVLTGHPFRHDPPGQQHLRNHTLTGGSKPS
jgi:hypothetical protein